MQGKPAGSLGPEVGALAEHAGADALVFVLLAGVTKSGGQVARDAAVTVLTLGSLVYKTSVSRVFVALVDGTTGAVHWWSWATRDAFAYEGEGLHTLVHDAFRRWPTLPASVAGDGASGDGGTQP
jgi:hypothetical protein